MKRYVLPTIKVLLVLAIAVALAKIAFFPSQEEPAGADVQPGYTVVTPTTTITTGDVSNTVDVSGQIVQDAAVPAPATLAGTVARIIYDNGDQVSAGDSILTLKKVEAQEPVTTTDEDGTITTTQPDPKVTWSEVYAPISGTIKYSVILDQEMTVGTAVATVTSGGFGPTVGAPIAMAMLPEGTGPTVVAELRGRRIPVRVVDLPFITPSYKR